MSLARMHETTYGVCLHDRTDHTGAKVALLVAGDECSHFEVFWKDRKWRQRFSRVVSGNTELFEAEESKGRNGPIIIRQVPINDRSPLSSFRHYIQFT